MTDATELKWKALSADFPQSAIGSKPKKNKETGQTTWLDYIGHAEVTERLNDVDPEWTWTPFAVADDGGPLVRTTEDGQTAELWINLTVLGVTRPAVGTAGTGAWSGEVTKELISDALRNGAMRFGVALSLWKRHESIGTAPTAGTTSRPAPESQLVRQPSAPRSNAGDQSGPISDGQSRNLYRLWHHVLHLDKLEYVEQILIATGLEITDDRELSSADASKVIRHLKELAGEEDTRPVFDPTPPVSDEMFLDESEPF